MVTRHSNSKNITKAITQDNVSLKVAMEQLGASPFNILFVLDKN